MTTRLRIGVGYDFLYWSNVARPGDQITPRVNTSQLPSSPTFGAGAASTPILPRQTTDFWLQSLDFSVALRF